MKKIYKAIFFVMVAILMTFSTNSCKNEPKRDYEKLLSRRIQNLNNQMSKLIGKKINSLDTIFKNCDVSYQNAIIFYYEGTDCQSCVDKCIHDIKLASHKNNQIDVKIIASNTKISFDQLRYEYFEKVYDDSDGLISKELMFLYSPAFIYLNNYRIETIDFILPDSKIDVASNLQRWSKSNLQR